VLSVVVIEADGLEAKDVNGKCVTLHFDFALTENFSKIEIQEMKKILQKFVYHFSLKQTNKRRDHILWLI